VLSRRFNNEIFKVTTLIGGNSVHFIVPFARELPQDVLADGGFLHDKAAAARYTIKGTRSMIIIV
jgi:hypothetical protein